MGLDLQASRIDTHRTLTEQVISTGPGPPPSGGFELYRAAEYIFHSPGKPPFIARATVKTVMRVLSAMGSMTVPTTVPWFHFRAIHPSRRSVMPA